jgi:archaellum component FlaC
MSVGRAIVLHMGLDERVATLEREVTAVRTGDIPTLEKKYRDVLTETRGWGGIAVDAKNTVSNASELLNRIYDEVRESRQWRQTTDARLDAMDKRFDKIDARLNKMDARFDKMDARFDKMDARMDRMDARLDKMDGRLDKMDGRLDKMDGRLDGIDGTLAEHGKLLLQILAKLP